MRLQLILQLIMQQPLWLIRSKQRAFNSIHVFFLHHEQPVKHNQIPHAKQRGGRPRPHLLSGVASRKLTAREQLAVQMVEMGRLGRKPLSDSSSEQGRGHLGVAGRETRLHTPRRGPTTGW